MQTFFIRHTIVLDISDAMRQRLWTERRIAVHYPHARNGKLLAKDNDSLDLADYHGKAKSVMGIFELLARDGGFVCAQYVGQSELLIGTIPPKSEVKLLRGKWGSSSRPAVLKSLQLRNAKTLNPRDCPIIAACRPQQGTIARWNAIGDTLAALIKNRKLQLSWDLLTPDRQEVACSEFLRLPDISQYSLPRLQSLLMPIGRTLKDVDIIGIARDGKRLFAQVTHSKRRDVAWKRDKLHQFVSPKDSHVILFCDCDKPTIEDGIHIFPVQKVFRILKTLAWGRQLLRGIR